MLFIYILCFGHCKVQILSLNFHWDQETEEVFPWVILQHPLSLELDGGVGGEDGDGHVVHQLLPLLHGAVAGAEALAGVPGAPVEWQLQAVHDADDAAGEALRGGPGHHVRPPGGGLAVVEHAGELLALVKLYPGDVHLAPAVSDLDVPHISFVNGGCIDRGS